MSFINLIKNVQLKGGSKWIAVSQQEHIANNTNTEAKYQLLYTTSAIIYSKGIKAQKTTV